MQLRTAVRFAVVAVVLSAVAVAPAQQPRPKGAGKAAAAAATLGAAHGAVLTAGADSITVRPRGADGRFGKELVLQLTGTSRVSQLTIQMRGGKPVAVQQDTDAKSLQPQQEVSVIYATVGEHLVLLSAVAAAAK